MKTYLTTITYKSVLTLLILCSSLIPTTTHASLHAENFITPVYCNSDTNDSQDSKDFDFRALDHI